MAVVIHIPLGTCGWCRWSKHTGGKFGVRGSREDVMKGDDISIKKSLLRMGVVIVIVMS